MKKHSTTIILILIFAVGLCLLLYPTVSNWWNTRHQSRAIANYSNMVSSMETDKKKEILERAKEYNVKRAEKQSYSPLTPQEMKEYNSMLDITGTGIMGYIEIPKINVSLPVYHTVSDEVLQVAVGHIEWTSLPVGGETSHCVVSGHRGLPSAKLFTNLDELTVGDLFTINVLDEILTYKVDQVLIVEPSNISSLGIVDGRDICTLVTCTPYGINSHRMLVRGTRTSNVEESRSGNVVSEAGIIDKFVIAPILASPILLGMFIYLMFKYKRKKK